MKWTDLFFKNESTLKKLANFDPKNALTPHTVNNLHFMSKNSILGGNRQLWILIFRLEKIIHNFLIFFWNWILGHNLRFCNSVFCPPWKKARKSRQKILHDFTKDEKLLKNSAESVVGTFYFLCVILSSFHDDTWKLTRLVKSTS